MPSSATVLIAFRSAAKVRHSTNTWPNMDLGCPWQPTFCHERHLPPKLGSIEHCRLPRANGNSEALDGSDEALLHQSD